MIFFVVVVLSGSKSWFCSITIQNLPSHRFCSSSSVCRWWAISSWMMGQSSATSNMEISSRIVSSLVSEAKTCSAKALILSSVSVMRTESSSNRNAFRSYNTMQHRTKLGGPHSGLPAMIYITKWKNFEENLGHDVLHCIHSIFLNDVYRLQDKHTWQQTDSVTTTKKLWPPV